MHQNPKEGVPWLSPVSPGPYPQLWGTGERPSGARNRSPLTCWVRGTGSPSPLPSDAAYLAQRPPQMPALPAVWPEASTLPPLALRLLEA